ncbi:MAG: glycosyl transferase family 2 [Acidobacteria bacterium]|nr:glycosyl transferase family 2 [Acidobacteriota bacterium]
MENGLPTELNARLEQLGEADIVAGIPSYNNARTIGHVVSAVTTGLSKYFPDRKAVLVNSDGGSKDGTGEAVLNAHVDADSVLLVQHKTSPIARISMPYHGVPGKGSAFRMIFGVARRLKAKACVVVDADLRSITPHWIELLVRPVLERNFDFIAPFYHRHKFDGTITNGIIYPMTRALFGKRMRQPIGGEFGFSGRLTRKFLEKNVWETDVARFGIDIWMTLTAVAEGFRVGQAYLGAKLHDAKDPGADLAAMFRQVVGSFFALMETYEPVWKNANGSQPVPMFGFPFEAGVEPVVVNVERMMNAYSQGAKDLHEIYAGFLRPETLDALKANAGAAENAFRIPDVLWVHTIYEFASAFHRRKVSPDHLMQALVPLYLGRTASFVLEMREASPLQVEERVEQLSLVFEQERPYLVTQWDTATGKEMSNVQHP